MGPIVKTLVSGLIAAVLATLAWSYAGRPQAVDDVKTRSAKMHCASYAPFRGSETPFNAQYRADPAHIEEDLTLLARSFDCVRTYTTDQGVDAVVPIARKVGLKVILGAWLGREAEGNAREIARTIALARDNADVVEAVIVGNEVLLRGDLPKAALKALIGEVKAAVPMPVTYADVWEFWLANPDMAEAVDFVTIHVLPYWENDPTPVDDAIDHVTEVLERVGRAFPGKHLLIGETGWPSEGRMRQGAAPSLVAQARYIRQIIAYTEAHDIDTNLIEAFDQPWKRQLEGTVGGHWGIYDAARHLKQALTGPVSNHPLWREQAAVSGVLALALIALCVWRRPRLTWPTALALAPFAALAGALATVSLTALIAVRPTLPHGLGALAGLAIILGTAFSLGRHWVDPDLLRRAARPEDVLDAILARHRFGPGQWLGFWRLAALFGAAAYSFGLIFDPRYRDFPTAIYLLPALGFAVEAVRRRRWALAEAGPVETLLCWLVLAQAGAILAIEGVSNTQAVAWCATLILLGLRIVSANDRPRTA